jgi:hypothetical protein
MFAPVGFGHLLRVVRLHETVAATGIWTAAAIAAGPPEAGFLGNAARAHAIFHRRVELRRSISTAAPIAGPKTMIASA